MTATTMLHDARCDSDLCAPGVQDQAVVRVARDLPYPGRKS